MAKETAQAMDYLDRQGDDGEAAVRSITNYKSDVQLIRDIAREN